MKSVGGGGIFFFLQYSPLLHLPPLRSSVPTDAGILLVHTVPVLEDDCPLVIVVGDEMVHRIPHDIYVHRLQTTFFYKQISNLFDLNYKGK
jgi:hypothetical protein